MFFPERRQALAFVEILEDRQLEICISYYAECESWQVIVQRFMAPTHHEVTAFESLLSSHASSFGGRADGWGCPLRPTSVA